MEVTDLEHLTDIFLFIYSRSYLFVCQFIIFLFSFFPTFNRTGKMSNTGAQQIDTNCVTLTRYILREQKKHPYATGELTMLMMGIQTAVKSISNAVRKAGIASL